MELFHALMNGSTLLVTDVNPDALLADESFRVVMQKRMFFLTSDESVKMKVKMLIEAEIEPQISLKFPIVNPFLFRLFHKLMGWNYDRVLHAISCVSEKPRRGHSWCGIKALSVVTPAF